jgi:dTDP-4-dehydrorhamnose reductase
MKILIAGGNGQLGREFSMHLEKSKHEAIVPPENQLDITNLKVVQQIVSETKPDVVINCAAYNLVDKAEEDYETAFRVNARGVQNLAIASKEHHAFLIHYGTDYVFSGMKGDFYREEDETDPLNNYGKT